MKLGKLLRIGCWKVVQLKGRDDKSGDSPSLFGDSVGADESPNFFRTQHDRARRETAGPVSLGGWVVVGL